MTDAQAQQAQPIEIPKVLESPEKRFIWGKTLFIDPVNGDSFKAGPGEKDLIELSIKDITCYVTQSQPTGFTNLAFPP